MKIGPPSTSPLLHEVIDTLLADGAELTPSAVLGIMGDLRAEHPDAARVGDVDDEHWWQIVDRWLLGAPPN